MLDLLIRKSSCYFLFSIRKTENVFVSGEVSKEDEREGLGTVEEVATVTAPNTMGTLLLCSQEICDGSGPGNEGFTSNCFAPHQ